MKKITDFIVNKRNIILVLFIILSCISLYFSTKVNINYDISKYLPNDSETRIGMDIMDEHFDEIKESSLNVMFKDLKKSDKTKIKKKLESIKNVESVSYDDNKEFNNDGYTLYIVNVNEVSDSKISKQVYEDVNHAFKDYEIYLSGSINDSNKPVLHNWIIAFAIFCAMVILIIMCDSYIEPFLFLFVIGLAVFMNKGTNIMFSSVSHITNSISAILQMALSMDYSIMLMNRYTQEREKSKDKVKAMKNALFNAFKSISSSSVTTIVGLLALVFMSFSIGKDLGFVLAKGVLFSLLGIFLCLPGLILLFDNLILKTKKKSLSLNLDKLGKLSHKLRYFILVIFIIVFAASFFLKNGLGILYTDGETDEISKHFDEQNQMAVIYDNKYEKDISNYCLNLKNNKIDKVLCYGNTINQKLNYGQLPKKLSELGSSVNIDDYLLKILYYNYYNKDNSHKMTYNEFVSFIENNVFTNEKLKEKIDNNTKNNIYKLNNFTDLGLVNKNRKSIEIKDILDIDIETINSLYILYNSDNISAKIKLSDFVNFLNNNVLNNDNYASMLSSEQKNMINRVNPFINKDIINKNMNSNELSELFGIDEESVKQLLLLYYTNVETNNKLSISELIIKTNYLKENTNYLDGKNVDKLISLYSVVSNKDNINSMKMNKLYLTNYFKDINSNLVNIVYQGAFLPDEYEMSPGEFISFTLDNFKTYLKEDEIKSLSILKLIIEDTITENKNTYTATEMSDLLNTDKNSMYNLYALIGYSDGYEYEMSPYMLVNLILNNKNNDLISSKIDTSKINTLNLLKKIMNGVNDDYSYSKEELSNLLNINNSDVSLLYSLYEIKVLNKEVTISINNFTNFLLNRVVTNSKYSSSFDQNTINKLNIIRNIIDSSINHTAYSSDDVYNNLNVLSGNLDKNLVELIYIYSGSMNNYNNEWELTIEEFVHYLNNNILTDERFTNLIDEDMRKTIMDSEKMVNDAKKLLVSDGYSRMIINTTYNLESAETFKFIQGIKDELKSKDKKIYVIGDSPMAYDMSNSFNGELDLITILTMVAIFVVVAITFKSLIIPLILVIIIQCAVFLTMGILSVVGGNVYFIALLIVQSILMGATIDYAIVYTSYYKESRQSMNVVNSIKNAYNKSIHTIITSASILIIVTLIVGNFASQIAAKICKTLSQGTLCSVILILIVLPAVLSVFDKLICRNSYKEK